MAGKGGKGPGDPHPGIHQAVDKPGGGIGDGGKENGLEGILLQPAVDFIKAL